MACFAEVYAGMIKEKLSIEIKSYIDEKLLIIAELKLEIQILKEKKKLLKKFREYNREKGIDA